MKQNEIALFFRQLATLINAHIPLAQSCHILWQSQKNKTMQHVIYTLKTEIESGSGLAKGLQKFPWLFNDMMAHLVHTGETTGTLNKILDQIAVLLEKSVTVKNQIKQALFYPVIVLSIALLICFFMMLFIVPRFADFFQQLHGQLPYFTRCIIQLSDDIRHHFLTILIFSLISFLLLIQLNRSKKRMPFITNTLAKLPIVRYFYTQFFILHFAKNLTVVYEAGINIADALKMISFIYPQDEHRIAIQHIQYKITSGQQLHIAMRSCKLFPPFVVQMVRVGEESGTLQKMLESVAGIYQAEIDRLVNKMNHLLEPLIMVILGVLIGGLVIAMYLPIFKLGMAI